MKRILFIALMAGMLSACHENLADRTAREAKEYTKKNCPTPPRDFTILDSITFNKNTLTLTRHYTLIGKADQPQAFEGKKHEMRQALLESMKNETTTKKMKEAGYKFAFIYRSQKNKEIIIYQDTFTEKDYQ